MENFPTKAEDQQPLLQMIFAKTSRTNIIRRFAKMSSFEIATANYTPICDLVIAHTLEKIEQTICVLVADVNVTFEGALKKEQIEEIAIEVTAGLTSNMPLELVFLALQDLKYEEKIFKLTPNKVLQAVKKKFIEYQDIRISKRESEHYQIKQQPAQISPKIVDMWKSIVDALPDERKSHEEAHQRYLKELETGIKSVKPIKDK